ncbi:MAG: hypothetical protein RIR49_1160 [Actinomycetota bacterium]|jgi:hypothetical protein
MGELVLLIVAAAWAAVLLPPLFRSRFENRPNSSVSDFHRQLSRLQGSAPTRGVGTMRTAGRPLVANQRTVTRSAPTNRLHARLDVDHAERPTPQRQPVRRSTIPQSELIRRRRMNVLAALVLTSGGTLFLAATTRETAMLYLFAIAFLALCGYLYLLASIRQRSVGPWSRTMGDDEWFRS